MAERYLFEKQSWVAAFRELRKTGGASVPILKKGARELLLKEARKYTFVKREK